MIRLDSLRWFASPGWLCGCLAGWNCPIAGFVIFALRPGDSFGLTPGYTNIPVTAAVVVVPGLVSLLSSHPLYLVGLVCDYNNFPLGW